MPRLREGLPRDDETSHELSLLHNEAALAGGLPGITRSPQHEGERHRTDSMGNLASRLAEEPDIMATILDQHPAPGGPGIAPRWTRGDKDAVVTAYSALSRVWFTLSRGIINEVYYPTIDRPQIRDLQYLITDGQTFFHDERRHLDSTYECLSPDALGFRIVASDPDGRYRIFKEVIADPHEACVLLRTRFEADDTLLTDLRVFALLAPHLEGGGSGNNGHVALAPWGKVLTAHKGGTWLVLGATVPFVRCSCGYVGTTDGWQDLARDLRMDWEFDCALDGNVALIGEVDLREKQDFVMGLAFGESLHSALVVLAQALGVPFTEHRDRFLEQWRRGAGHALPGWQKVTGDGGRLFRASHSLVMAHEDKIYKGALIASLGIPWGETKGDEDLGGYHLVWTRDLYHAATSMLAVGHDEIPFRALVYLACTQREDGGFYQNFWLNGEPYWRSIQLDEVAFPILLAWQLRAANALRDFDPWPMVCRAACYLIREGPATPQERWEENSGYSPSTLAAHTAALICAASFARERCHAITALYLEEYADFLEAHIEAWTVTTQGTLVPGIQRHFIRIHPTDTDDPQPNEDPNLGALSIRNRPPGAATTFPAKEIVDAGFLELVRYGIRGPGNPLIEDSLQVVDELLRVDTPFGPGWRRYNHDGYGQRDDGAPYQGWGRGRAWPLLTGERGHYELATGRNVRPFLQAMEAFSTATGLLPEQVWDETDRPDTRMFLGRPTGSATPLAWAHAEYLKLVRSAADGQVFDLIPVVVDRYRKPRATKALEIWKFNRQPRAVLAGWTLRIQASAPFRLRWSGDDWRDAHEIGSTPAGLGVEYADIPVPLGQTAPFRFTFLWTEVGRWEGRDFQVALNENR